MNSNCKKYCQSIRKCLVCPGYYKRRFLKELNNNLTVYSEDHPEASYSDIIEHFGSPEDVVASYLDTISPSELARRMKFGRYIKISIVIITIFVLIAAFIIYKRIDDGIAVYEVDEFTETVVEEE